MSETENIVLTHCPICGYGLFTPMPKQQLMFSFAKCDCCGCEYGADDTPLYRQGWLRNGAPWFNGTPPANWDLDTQLLNAQMDWNADQEQL